MNRERAMDLGYYTPMDSQRRDALKKKIETEVFVTKEKERIVHPGGKDVAWLFDFRRVVLQPDTLDTISEIFWDTCNDAYPFQVGGVEVASLPLITGFVLKCREKGQPANGFFIRKSRKKNQLLRMIEGTVTDEPIILVDDVLNSGGSFIRQVEILEALGKKVVAVFALLRFRNLSYYSYFHDKGIKVITLFELNDLQNALPVENMIDRKELPVPMPFHTQWYWKSEKPDFFKVIPKSAPTLDGTRLYFGTDNGSFWALNQTDGTTAWEYKIPFGSRAKKTFSAPAVSKDSVYVGAHDGTFYALDKETGKRRWTYMEADWVESSPCLAPDLGLVFVNLEFGIWNKLGAFVALDERTGKKRWEAPLAGTVHASPAYAAGSDVVISAADDTIAAFRAATGSLLWTFKAEGNVTGSFAFDERREIVCFGSFDSYLYILNLKTGALIHTVKVNGGIYSTPAIYDRLICVASLDKNVYGIDSETGSVIWTFTTKGRIFASPSIIGDKIYIGSNDARLYELDAATGKNTAFFPATERITDAVAYNADTGALFVSTFANEIYCLTRKPKGS
jgi:outer membrane protein assembly factor BamB